MSSNYHVYILQSCANSRFYIGQTGNLTRRLSEHNGDKARYTKGGQPWKLLWEKEVESRAEAMQLELQIKKRGAQRFLNDNGFAT